MFNTLRIDVHGDIGLYKPVPHTDMHLASMYTNYFAPIALELKLAR